MIPHGKKTLGPVIHYDAYTDAIQRDVFAYFRDVAIEPIDAKLRDLTRSNATSEPLKNALRSGAVWYADGAFRGTFNGEISAALAKEGAKHRGSAWSVSIASIPVDVRHVLYEVKDKTAKTVAGVSALVLLMRNQVGSADTGINIVSAEKRILDGANTEFNAALRDFDAGRNPVGIPSNMKAVAEEINEAVRNDSRRVMQEELAKLSDELSELAHDDAPLDALKKTIERAKKRIVYRTRGISEHAAALLLSRFRREQAMRLGLRSYIWKTMRDDRVRHDHRELEGKMFTWDNPPITNHVTGARNHPGSDFGCRCVPALLIPTNIPAQ